MITILKDIFSAENKVITSFRVWAILAIMLILLGFQFGGCHYAHAEPLSDDEWISLSTIISYDKPLEATVGIQDKSTRQRKWYLNVQGCECSKHIQWSDMNDDLSLLVKNAITFFEKIDCGGDK